MKEVISTSNVNYSQITNHNLCSSTGLLFNCSVQTVRIGKLAQAGTPHLSIRCDHEKLHDTHAVGQKITRVITAHYRQSIFVWFAGVLQFVYLTHTFGH
jgi:hypothetical protein